MLRQSISILQALLRFLGLHFSWSGKGDRTFLFRRLSAWLATITAFLIFYFALPGFRTNPDG
jgi:hypothetical protein